MSDIAALIETATNTSEGSFRRKMAVADLARSGEPRAIETLITLLDDDDTYLRREVVSGLAKTEDAIAIEPLISVLQDDDDYLQRDAAEALGRFGDRRATDPLRELLDADSYSVRYAAERSLKQIEERAPASDAAEVPQPAAAHETGLAADHETGPASSDPAAPQAEAVPLESAEADASETGIQETSVQETNVQADVIQATPVDIPKSPEPPTTDVPLAVATESPVSSPLTPVPAVPPPTPLPPVATISAVQPDDGIVTAELSTSPSRQRAGTTEDGSSETPQSGTRHRDWRAARRFPLVFGDGTTELRKLYKSLGRAEAKLLQSEQEYRVVLERLGDEQSANRDGLQRLEHGLDKATKELAELQRETNRNRRKLYKLEQAASSISFQISSFMSSEKVRQNREATRKLKSEIERLGAVASATGARKEKIQQQYDALNAPLEQLRQQAEALAESRATGRQAIGEASQRIDLWMSEYLMRLPTEDLRQRITALSESSPNATVLSTCADELVRAVAEMEEYSLELLEVEVAAQQAVAGAQSSTDALGEAIAAGFRLTSTERRTNVRLSGSLRFSEERGTFSGFSGAEGTARGSGSGQAAYTVDEVQWTPTSEFRSNVTAFTDAWNRCGAAAARSELLQVLVVAARRRTEDLTRLIRTEVELDFTGGRAE